MQKKYDTYELCQQQKASQATPYTQVSGEDIFHARSAPSGGLRREGQRQLPHDCGLHQRLYASVQDHKEVNRGCHQVSPKLGQQMGHALSGKIR